MDRAIVLSINRTVKRYEESGEILFLSVLQRLIENNDGELRKLIKEISSNSIDN